MPRGFVSHLDLNVSDPVASSAFYGIVLETLGFARHGIDDAGRIGLSQCHGVSLLVARPSAHRGATDRIVRFGRHPRVMVRPPFGCTVRT